MANGQKHYTEEFKREAVRLLVTRGAQSVAEIAKSLVPTSFRLSPLKRFAEHCSFALPLQA